MNKNLEHFWENYEHIMNWGGTKISKTKTMNNYYTQIKENSYNKYNSCNDTIYANDTFSESSEEIDTNYLEFSRATLKHQKKIEMEKRSLDKCYGLCNSSSSEESVINSIQIEIPHEKIYGLNANKIKCQENILQSKFNNYCIHKKPVLWPGMAFNLSLPEPELHLDLKTQNRPF
ncbi:uncharacterized protein LOC126905900 [Daktulosphaira vitifoliae]|uniref:uncharacterized protein LOC126905900 n=1 Tax=Daktulosphaira vitifoliae TaxID=58002 RepID=UPI0021AB0914|nr:uncharacterized protein LOC126905900 [Daktulosphaira vitifoliae]